MMAMMLSTVSLSAAGDVPTAADGPATAAERTEMREEVLKAIRELPAPQREVTTLFYVNGCSQKDIADFLEVPVSTVNNRLMTLRRRLKERMLNMMEDSLKSHRPGQKGRQAIIDELMGRKQSFDAQRWKPSQEWAQKWHDLGAFMPDAVAGMGVWGSRCCRRNRNTGYHPRRTSSGMPSRRRPPRRTR